MVDRRVPGTQAGRRAQRNAARALITANRRLGKQTPKAVQLIAEGGYVAPEPVPARAEKQTA